MEKEKIDLRMQAEKDKKNLRQKADHDIFNLKNKLKDDWTVRVNEEKIKANELL